MFFQILAAVFLSPVGVLALATVALCASALWLRGTRAIAYAVVTPAWTIAAYLGALHAGIL